MVGVAIPWLPIVGYRIARAAAWEPSQYWLSPDWQVAVLIGAVIVVTLVVIPRLRAVAFGLGIGCYFVFIFGAAALRG
jgi:hypothetical protein